MSNRSNSPNSSNHLNAMQKEQQTTTRVQSQCHVIQRSHLWTANGEDAHISASSAKTHVLTTLPTLSLSLSHFPPTHYCPCPARKACSARLFGASSPNPQPPSLVCAITAPAHFPVLNAQQSDSQSASLVQGPVMNWVPGAAAAEDGAGAAAAAAVPAPAPPKPQPAPSRATSSAAHLPVLAAQQLDAQSASLVQSPVMNCVPCALVKRVTEGRRIC